MSVEGLGDHFYDRAGTVPIGRYLYHYTNVASAGLILESMTLRLGELARTNDPREYQQWWPSFSRDEDTDVSHEEWVSLCREVDAAFKDEVYVACFTEDREPSPPAYDLHMFHRGWARARMWDQYAQRHEGLCLILDREAWVEAVQEVTVAAYEEAGVAPVDRFVVHQKVTYVDQPVGQNGQLLHFDVRTILREGALSLVAQRQRASADHLFFQKNTDWQSEQEFRSIAIGLKGAQLVPFGECLRGVAVGDACPTDLIRVVKERMVERGRGHAVGQCHWREGAPHVLPVL